MKQKRFLSLLLVMVILFSMTAGMQTTWAIPAPPTISTMSTLYADEADGLKAVITLENGTLIEGYPYASVSRVPAASGSLGWSNIRDSDTQLTVTITTKLEVGDVVSIYIPSYYLTSSAVDTNAIELTVQPARALAIDTTAPKKARLNGYYSHDFSAIGGYGNRTYECTGGTLPDGLDLNSDGELSGSSTTLGTYTFEITVTDSGTPEQTSKGSYTISVIEPPQAGDYLFMDNTIYGYTGDGGDITIPSEIDGEAVTAIAEYSFENNTDITSVIIPDGVTQVGGCSFSGCTGLTWVTMPDSVTFFGNYTFAGCTKLTEVTIPNGVKSLVTGAFEGCTGLTRVTIPSSVTETFQVNTFNRCTNLKSAFFMGNAPSYFEEGAFSGCADDFKIYYISGSTGFTPTLGGYTTVALQPSEPAAADTAALTWNTIKGTNVSQNSVTSNLNLTVTGAVYGAPITWISDNEDVIEIRGNTGIVTRPAFSSGDENVTVTASVYCNGVGDTKEFDLKVLKFEESDYIFDLSTGIITGYTGEGGALVIPSSINGVDVTGIGDYAFDGCTSLTSVTIPSSVTSIGEGAFTRCKNLASITVDDDNAEYSSNDGLLFNKAKTLLIACPGAKTSVTIPDSVTIIGRTAFNGCKALTSVTIPSSVTGIESYAFSGCKALTEVTIPSSVTSIGNSAFSACTALTGVTISSGVTSIGSSAFFGCTSLSSITIPGSVTSIGFSAFCDCSNLKSAIFMGNAPTIIEDNAFTYCDAGFKVYYLSGSTGFTSPTWNGYPSAVLQTVSIGTITGGSIIANPAMAATGDTINLTIIPDAGKRLKTGTLKYNDGTDHAITGRSFTMPAVNVTVTAQFEAKPTSGGGGSNGGSSGTTTTTAPAGATEPSAAGTTTTAAKSDANGRATAAVTTSQVTEAVNKAVAEAAKQGAGVAAKVEIKVTAPANSKTVETSIPKAAFSAIADSSVAALTITTPIGAITFDGNALDTISKEAEGDVKVTISKVDVTTLPEETKQAVGDRPVFNFSVTSGGKTISQFGGNVEVSVPYTPKAGEDTSAIVIYYINAEGKLEIVSNCAYDPATGTINFSTNHFSQYVIGYNKVNFKDVAATASYSKAVSFISARGITSGTGDGNFSPEATITRGQFIVMLMKAYGIKPYETAKDNFADAGNTYYTGYLAAAKRLGLTNGTGNNMYAPDKEMTQQEMVTLLYKTLKQMDKLPAGTTGKELTAYTDAEQIAVWAKDAMALFVKTGIITGSENRLAPAGNTSRAQMAQVLYNLMTK